MSHYNNKYFDKVTSYNIKDKKRALDLFRRNTLNKTTRIFQYHNLPETIPHEMLELYLQTDGAVVFYEHEGKLYVFTGGFGGVPDEYYRPTVFTVANPALKLNETLKIGIDCVVMKNDTMYTGLMPLIDKYAVLLIETDISFHNSIINTRIVNVISADDDKTKKGAELYLEKIKEGELSIIAGNALTEGAKLHPTAARTGTLNDLKETYQYLKSLLYTDLGMKVSHNMKREYVSEEENIVNDDTLLPLIDDMLEQRRLALKAVNEMFGTNIEVELSGAWKLQADEIEAEQAIIDRLLEGEDINEEQEGTGAAGTEQSEEAGENEGIEEDQTEEDPAEEEDTTEENGTEENGTEEDTTEENTTEEVKVEVKVVVEDNTEEVEENEPTEN